ncbi:hypothetical protein PLUTE_a0423 [Pseudoalteromonas luteoviolacea DSM 6061]|nr:hypothetical protein [Pseudoalteromonas luteoviolacea DSM 6061]
MSWQTVLRARMGRSLPFFAIFHVVYAIPGKEKADDKNTKRKYYF